MSSIVWSSQQDSNKLLLNRIVATYPLAGGRGKIEVSIFQKGEHAGVATNNYSRENVRKTKRRFANFKNEGSRVVYAWERY